MVAGASIVIGLLMVAVVVLYAYGTPQAPQAPTTSAAVQALDESAGQPLAVSEQPPAEAAPAEAGEQTAQQPQGEQPAEAEQPKAPLAIEIPGCVCHSKDPKVVAEHAKYRMNECAGCHADGMPDGMR